MTNILLSRGLYHHPDLAPYLKTHIKAGNKVLIIALSFFAKHIKDEKDYNSYYGKGGKYYDKMIKSFSLYNITEKDIDWLHYYNDTPDLARQKIKQADIIYFPGGAPDLMMKRIKAFGIKKALEDHNKVFIGSSAGAMIQLRDYHISPDFDYKSFSYEQGLDLLKGFSIEVHYRRKKKQKAALRKVNRAFKHEIYGLPDDGAIIIDQGRITCLKTAVKLYSKKGVFK